MSFNLLDSLMAPINKARNENLKYYNAVTTDLEQRGIFNGPAIVNKAVVAMNKPHGSVEGSSAKYSPRSTYSSGYVVPSTSSAPTSADSVDYKDADLAKHYGMDAKTAYQEALNNTAIRRQMADLKAAGLNQSLLLLMVERLLLSIILHCRLKLPAVIVLIILAVLGPIVILLSLVKVCFPILMLVKQSRLLQVLLLVLLQKILL